MAILVPVLLGTIYATTTATNMCGKGIGKAVMRNFVHADLVHLTGNLATFWLLVNRLPLSSIKLLELLGLLVVLTTGLDLMAQAVFPSLTCSIGFSGVLFGLLAWEVIRSDKVSWAALGILVAMVVYPSLQNPRASLVGHGLGAVAGVLASAII